MDTEDFEVTFLVWPGSGSNQGPHSQDRHSYTRPLPIPKQIIFKRISSKINKRQKNRPSLSLTVKLPACGSAWPVQSSGHFCLHLMVSNLPLAPRSFPLFPLSLTVYPACVSWFNLLKSANSIVQVADNLLKRNHLDSLRSLSSSCSWMNPLCIKSQCDSINFLVYSFMKQWAFGYAASLQAEDTRTNHLLSGGKVEVKNWDFVQLKWFLIALLLCLPWSPKRWRLAVSFFPHLTLTVVDFSGMCSRDVPFFGTLQPLSFCTLNFSCISVELKVRQGATEITRNRERRGIEFHHLSL